MGNPDKIVAVGLGEVLYDHDVVTDEYTFGGARPISPIISSSAPG